MVQLQELVNMQVKMGAKLAELKEQLPKFLIERECMHCGKIVGVKLGFTPGGKTSAICDLCLETYYPQYAILVKLLRQEA